MKRGNTVSLAITSVALATVPILGHSQERFDKYSLVLPNGIAFSNFRGYEDSSVVSSVRADEVLKVIVANPVAIQAFLIEKDSKRFPKYWRLGIRTVQ